MTKKVLTQIMNVSLVKKKSDSSEQFLKFAVKALSLLEQAQKSKSNSDEQTNLYPLQRR